MSHKAKQEDFIRSLEKRFEEEMPRIRREIRIYEERIKSRTLKP